MQEGEHKRGALGEFLLGADIKVTWFDRRSDFSVGDSDFDPPVAEAVYL